MKETKDNEQKDGFITGKETSCILSELIELIDSTKLYDKKGDIRVRRVEEIL